MKICIASHGDLQSHLLVVRASHVTVTRADGIFTDPRMSDFDKRNRPYYMYTFVQNSEFYSMNIIPLATVYSNLKKFGSGSNALRPVAITQLMFS